MALRTKNGEPISTELEWLKVFKHTMSFYNKASATYAKHLHDEKFTGDILKDCVGDSDVKESLGMCLGEYKKLVRFVKQFLLVQPQAPPLMSIDHRSVYLKYLGHA